MEPILREARIDPEIFQWPERFMSFPQACSFIDGAAHREGIEDLGLQAGAATRSTSMGLVGEVISKSLTLKDLIRNLIRLAPVTNTGSWMTCEATSEEAMELRMYHTIEGRCSQAEMYVLMLLIDWVRTVFGPEWRPCEISLDAAAKPTVLRYEALSEARINSDVDYVGIQIPRYALSLPLRSRERQGGSDAEQLLRRTAPPSDFEGTLALVLEGMLLQGSPTIETAAEMAGASVRTLQRRLSESGSSYGSLLDRIRFEKVIELMDSPGTRFKEIAYRLGFSDAANFTRAFRRWTGISPKEFRRRRIPDRG